MSGTRYRRGGIWAADMAHYTSAISDLNSNTEDLDRVKLNLARCINQDVTEKQRAYLTMYYVDGLKMQEIGQRMGVDKSTVSRTIHRGELRLRRCLRYGAAALLDGPEDDD